MNKKFRKVFAEKCKDFGLTDKAIDELAELAAKDLPNDAADEDIAEKADLFVPFAKAMQGEITRKTQNKQSTKPSNVEGDGEGGEQMPIWFAQYQTRLEKLEQENKDLKAEKIASARTQSIADKAKSLGIPDFLIKGRAFADDADIDKELAAFKQQLVNHNLVPKEQTHERVTSIEQMKSQEDTWAKSLPDKVML